MIFRGRVRRSRYATGTKSQQNAVLIETPQGTFRLRRAGGTSFSDRDLDDLVGHDIVCEGQLHRDTVLMTEWSPADPVPGG